MNDPTPSPLYIGESPAAVPVPRVVERAYLWAVGGVGGLATALLLMFAVANQSGMEADRIAASAGDGYMGSLLSAMASGHSRKPL